MKTVESPQRIKEVGQFYDRISSSHYDYLHFWMKNTLFHWDFFLSLILTILPWVVWWKLRKKESSSRLIFVGFFVLIITSWMDFWGVMLGLWFYTGKVIPSMPSYVPWDFCILPVFIMLLIQFKSKLSPYLKALIFAAGSSFIGEPLFLWLGFYVIKKWSVFYSFPIFYCIYLVSHKLSRMKNFAEI